MNGAESLVRTLVAGGVNICFPTCHAQYKALGSESRAFGHAFSMQPEYAIDGAKLG
jgi:hypothetical protein